MLENNTYLQTDVYKMGHMEQYCDGVDFVSSYLQARSSKMFDRTVFFGLQYYLKRYLSQRLTHEMADEFLAVRKAILGSNSAEVVKKIHDLSDLGYWPLEIRAVPEGSVVPVQNVLMTIRNTHPDFHWCVGFVESLLLKVWYPTTVASHSYAYRQLLTSYWRKTVSDVTTAVDHYVHDFGYRGDASEEGAGISGVAHLLSFLGSDNVPAFGFAKKWYGADETVEPIMLSVLASEHSVMCSFGRENELAAFQKMLRLYPDGFVSIVSDTFNVYVVLTDFAQQLKPTIVARVGKTVFRPDSGEPEHIICGDPGAAADSREGLGAVKLLDQGFGHTVNGTGFRELDSHVGLIYGDGMYLERYARTLERLMRDRYAASNLVIGVGGILRHHTRDTFGFAIKATVVGSGGVYTEIEKDPVTDHKKKSHKGFLLLERNADGSYYTRD